MAYLSGRARVGFVLGQTKHLGEALVQTGIEERRIAPRIRIDIDPDVTPPDVRGEDDHGCYPGDGPEGVDPPYFPTGQVHGHRIARHVAHLDVVGHGEAVQALEGCARQPRDKRREATKRVEGRFGSTGEDESVDALNASGRVALSDRAGEARSGEPVAGRGVALPASGYRNGHRDLVDRAARLLVIPADPAEH